MVDPERGCSPQCGYGLLGLCCSACLQGPCRRSPFDGESGGEFCGEDRDWIVARNVIDRVVRESLQAMAPFKSGLERAAGRENPPAEPRLAEMRALLSPFSGDSTALWERICPGRAFPSLQAFQFSAVPWCAALLEMAAVETEPPREIEAQLAGAIRLSAMTLAAEALSRGMAAAAPPERERPLPASAAPLLLLVSDGGAVPGAGPEALFEAIESACRKEAPICRLSHVSELPAFGRKLYDRWGIPASLSGSIAVVASSSMTHGLGALALGFSVAAVPPYPIHGSERVENYLTRQLKSTVGHGYLAIKPYENIVEQLLGGLPR